MIEQILRYVAGSEVSSDAIAALLGAVVGSIIGGLFAISGTLGAQYFQYWLRRKGKVRCFVLSLRTSYPEPNFVNFSFPLHFHNHKEVAVSISDLVLTIWHEGKCLVRTPVADRVSGEVITYLDLPPRETARRWAEIQFPLHEDTVNRIRSADKRMFRVSWTYTTGSRETITIPTNVRFKWYEDLWYRITSPFRSSCDDHNPYEPFKRLE